MRANHHDMLLCESSFLLFCYGPEARPPLPKESLTSKQWLIYKHLKSGMNAREISEITGMSSAAVFSHIGYIKKKGWAV